MVEFKELTGFVLLLVFIGMLLGIGILVLDQFGVVAKDSTAVTDEQVAMSSSAGNTANDDVTAVSSFYNSTNSSDLYTVLAGNWTSAGALSFTVNDGTYNVSYVYDADSVATTATTNTVSAISPIASTWLPLIVTVFVLAIILMLVIQSFAGYGKR